MHMVRVASTPILPNLVMPRGSYIDPLCKLVGEGLTARRKRPIRCAPIATLDVPAGDQRYLFQIETSDWSAELRHTVHQCTANSADAEIRDCSNRRSAVDRRIDVRPSLNRYSAVWGADARRMRGSVTGARDRGAGSG